MQGEKITIGQNEDEIFEQLRHDFAKDAEILQYRTLIKQQDTTILLDIDIDLGGGFEGGYATTTFTAPIYNSSNFRFAIHHEGFLDEVGKFFGMQDVVIGFAEFDKKVIVKTNDEIRIHALFVDEYVRDVFQSLADFVLHIVLPHSSEGAKLELRIEDGITDLEVLKTLYKAFYRILTIVEVQ